MSAFQVVVSHKLDSLWKMLLNEEWGRMGND